MNFVILNNGIQIEDGGVSIAFIAIKVFLLLVGSIFILFALPSLIKKKPVEDPNFNHPFIMFVSGIFWFTVGLLIPLGTEKTSIFLDRVSRKITITKESTNLQIPFSEFQFFIVLPDSAFVEEEEDTKPKPDSETKHISLLTSYGFELELGSFESNKQNQNVKALVTLLGLPVLNSISEIPKGIAERSKQRKLDFNTRERKIQTEWDWVPVPSILYLLGSAIVFLYGVCLVYYFLRLAPAKKFPSFTQILWGVVFIFFSGFILYITIIYGWGRNRVSIGKERLDREFSVFGYPLSVQSVPKKSFGSLYLSYPLGKDDQCILYLVLQSEKFENQWVRIYETKWENMYRFDEPNLFFKMKVCDLTLTKRLQLMKDIHEFSLTEGNDRNFFPSESKKEKTPNSY
ncbi:hypothetical protein EHQ68_10385 [Leptospira congkakensis]|uniref:Uncharacterized protein n=1 Tax=Leptospira congkakensis TaxID=2484932 RepID=A0A4Z1A3M5_9LEPT|nr:hypothetical protein [Leptospira congkakensis]TGL88224.1 hypothetical protein EHQ68_10385 [Leptospira congkakensis]TGL95329.1 hypothetical protein EHQ69_02570 [Leptospira congkakensis]TGL96410.1 hypothetical protein EHQ70_09620 [Leptospira congkakensis]